MYRATHRGESSHPTAERRLPAHPEATRRKRRGFGNREGMGAVGFFVVLGLIGLKFYARHQRHQEWQKAQDQAQAQAAPTNPGMQRGPGANFDGRRDSGGTFSGGDRITGTSGDDGSNTLAGGTPPGVTTPVRPADGPVEVSDLDDTNFASVTDRGVVLVDFWATWCGPCRTQGPIVEQVASRVGGSAQVAKLDVDKAPRLAARYSIRSIPTLIVFADGRPVQRFTGVTREETLVAAVTNALQTLPPESRLATANVDPQPLPPVSSLDDIPLPDFPELGTAERYEEDGEHVFSRFDVELQSTSTGPGQNTKLRIYLPASKEGFARRPLILVPPAGSNLLHGLSIDESDGLHPEHDPYVRAGFVVATFSLDGPIDDIATASGVQVKSAYEQFVAAHAGVVNARNALAYTLAKVPQVDRKRVFVAGHSSAGTLALDFAAHESQLAGCIAFAPVSDIRGDLGEQGIQVADPGFQQAIPGAIEFDRRFSPINLADRVSCPVFLFHAEDDSRVDIEQTRRMAGRLHESTGVKLVTWPQGGHYESMVSTGIPAAIQWIVAGTPVDAKPTASGENGDIVAIRPDGVVPAPQGEDFTPLRASGTRAVSQLRQQAGKLTGTYRDLANRKIFIEIIAAKDPEGVTGDLEFQVKVRFAQRIPSGGFKLDDRGKIVYREVIAALSATRRNEVVADVGGLTQFVFPATGSLVTTGGVQGTFSRVRR